jgi:lipoprotein NlpI
MLEIIGMWPHYILVHISCLYFIICPYFLEGDPNNYLTYFKRGTVYLALGKSKFALMDLDKVLQLKPDFTSVSILNNRELDRGVKVDTFSLCVCDDWDYDNAVSIQIYTV